MTLPRARFRLPAPACLALLLCWPALAQSELHTLEHDGLSRSYTLHLPNDAPPTEPLPLVMVLHGRTGTGAGTARLTGFDARADRHGFIAVYPDGIGNEWSYAHGIPGYGGPDDSGFLLALIDELARRYPVDPDRVYVTGISNGGFMVQRLACEFPERFAAFASVAAGGFGGMEFVCLLPYPVSMLLIHGTDDNNILWDGITVERGGRVIAITYSIPDTVGFWGNFSGCGNAYQLRELPQLGGSPGTLVRIFTFGDCPEERELILYAIVGGGHNWPGVPGVIPEAVAGRVNTDIHASDVIWEFFDHSLRVGATP